MSLSFLTQGMLYGGKPQHTSKTAKSSVYTFNVSLFLQIYLYSFPPSAYERLGNISSLFLEAT